MIIKHVSKAIAVLHNQCYYTENVQLLAHMKTVTDLGRLNEFRK